MDDKSQMIRCPACGAYSEVGHIHSCNPPYNVPIPVCAPDPTPNIGGQTINITPGCICPPTSEQTCESQFCPRKRIGV